MIEILHREWVYLWYYFTVQLEQIFQFWVLGIVLGSIISVFGKEKIHRLFEALQKRKLGALGVIPASAIGIASPLCMYGTIPIAASFSEKGMKIVLGVKRFVLYIVFSMAFAFVSGLLVDLIM